jgi:hypothetical protein
MRQIVLPADERCFAGYISTALINSNLLGVHEIADQADDIEVRLSSHENNSFDFSSDGSAWTARHGPPMNLTIGPSPARRPQHMTSKVCPDKKVRDA